MTAPYDPTPEQSFVAAMPRLRKALGLSQTALAQILAREDALPFHQPTIQRIEAGLRPVRIDEAYAIARTLGSTVPAMCGDVDAQPQRDTDELRARISEIAADLAALAAGGPQ